MEDQVFETENVTEVVNEDVANQEAAQNKLNGMLQNDKLVQTIAALDKNKFWILTVFVLLVAVLLIVRNMSLEEQNMRLQQDVQMLKSQFSNIDSQVAQKIDAGRKIYVFSLDDTVLSLGMLDKKKLFEQKVNKLNDEVRAAEKKLKGIKDQSVRSEYSEVYMKSLQIKRNNLIMDYEKEMAELNNRINKALEDVVVEQKLPAVWSAKNIAVATPDVVDITEAVIAKLQKPEETETQTATESQASQPQAK
ncbi:MAG: OmpH family outer membrane protein [Alphaproteobacteria bacterium]|nr:OmpH family outer membrane protein [Alphaproteobacteria bacterium]